MDWPALQTRLENVGVALSALPPLATWLWCGGIFAVFALAAAGLGRSTGFLKIEPMVAPRAAWYALPAILFLRPALLEELFFRGLLLPHPRENPTWQGVCAAGAISLMLFILSHPVNALLFRPAARAVFTSRAFLGVVALLGLACTVAYELSGSLWPSVLIHWITVAVWTMWLGGRRLLHGQTPAAAGGQSSEQR